MIHCPNCGEFINFKHIAGNIISFKCPYCCAVFFFDVSKHFPKYKYKIEYKESRFKDLSEEEKKELTSKGLYTIIDENLLGSKHEYDRCIFCGGEVFLAKEYDFTYKYKDEERKRHDRIFVCKNCGCQLAFGLFGHNGINFNKNHEEFTSYIHNNIIIDREPKCPFCKVGLRQKDDINCICPECGLLVVRYKK